MARMQFKTEMYRGFRVFFRPLTINNFRVAAQVPKITSQFIGAGRTKRIAFNQAKKVIDKVIARRRKGLPT